MSATKKGIRPTQARIRASFERGVHEPGDLERRRGYHVGTLGSVE